MRLLKFAALGSLVVLLSACQSFFKPGLDDPLPTERLASEHLKPGCQGEQCPLVNIDTLKFPDEPQLDPIVERALLEMTRENNETPLPASLAAYERQFLDSAEPGWSSYLQAKVREQHDGLVIIELSSYLFTGGAHGMPGRGFINYDRRQHKVLSLQDMLVPSQEEAFWKQAELAHKAWLLANKLDQDADFQKTWPFQRTPHVALTFGAVTLKYDAYSIAPYSYAHPELKIPYPRLNGIVKPNLFPGRG